MLKSMVLALFAFMLALPGTANAQADKADPETALNVLIEDLYAFDLGENPQRAAQEGDFEALKRWRDVSPAAAKRRAAASAAFAKRLAGIDKGALGKSSMINAGLLQHILDDRINRSKFNSAAMPFTNDSGFHTELDFVVRQTQAKNADEARAWIARLNALPAYFEQHTDNLRAGLKSGITQPRNVIDAVIATIKTTINDDAFDGSFTAPFKFLPRSMPASERAALEAELVQTVTTKVRPAHEKLLAFFEDEYRPTTRQSIGISEVPGGADYYEHLVHAFTTTQMSAQQVHDVGKAEVARIRAEMEAVITETGFKGDFAQFLHFLRTDPQFYAKSEAELLHYAAWLAKKADDQMPSMFGHLPRLPYGVRPVPKAIAPNYTSARYWEGDSRTQRAGGYMVNTYALDQRPLYELPALTLHEAVPGHHHQISISQELEDVPEFRKELYFTAFGEGWGLYSEKLGLEMGMYTTPYDHFGRLTYEMWRACRLVMDTGIHAFGWTREQAMACLKDNSALALHNIETETDRYISWPGQALGYKIGELTIVRLRKRAEEELGDAFNVRDFHDEILGDGAVTMSMLETKIDTWIAEQKAAQ